MTNQRLLEICVDSFSSARAAIEGGADRLELCSALVVGGLTPGISLLEQIREISDIPVNCLMRPRFGDFLYTKAEILQICRDMELLKQAGASGFVVGALTPEGALDASVLKEFASAANGKHLTLHRAFDVCSDAFKAMETASECGIHTILTSGQCNFCMDGLPLIEKLLENPYGIHILIGSGVNSQVIRTICSKLPKASQFHLSAKKIVDSGMLFRRQGVSMGLPSLSEYEIYQTDLTLVRQAHEALYGSFR